MDHAEVAPLMAHQVRVVLASESVEDTILFNGIGFFEFLAGAAEHCIVVIDGHIVPRDAGLENLSQCDHGKVDCALSGSRAELDSNLFDELFFYVHPAIVTPAETVGCGCCSEPEPEMNHAGKDPQRLQALEQLLDDRSSASLGDQAPQSEVRHDHVLITGFLGFGNADQHWAIGITESGGVLSERQDHCIGLVAGCCAFAAIPGPEEARLLLEKGTSDFRIEQFDHMWLDSDPIGESNGWPTERIGSEFLPDPPVLSFKSGVGFQERSKFTLGAEKNLDPIDELSFYKHISSCVQRSLTMCE